MNRRTENPNLQLMLGIMLSFAGGALVTVAGFVLTIVYLFTTRNLHTSGPPDLSIYLVAPAFGVLVAITGSWVAWRRWVRSKR